MTATLAVACNPPAAMVTVTVPAVRSRKGKSRAPRSAAVNAAPAGRVAIGSVLVKVTGPVKSVATLPKASRNVTCRARGSPARIAAGPVTLIAAADPGLTLNSQVALNPGPVSVSRCGPAVRQVTVTCATPRSAAVKSNDGGSVACGSVLER